jgi:hypothetical protein
VYERDRDDHAFLLVLAEAPRFMLAGWLWGREAEKPEWDPRRDATDRAWCVPQSALRVLANAEAAACSS